MFKKQFAGKYIFCTMLYIEVLQLTHMHYKRSIGYTGRSVL